MRERPNRYDINRPLQYRVREGTRFVSGTGRTLNISRKGVLFHTEGPMRVGSKIEITVQMGAPMDDGPAVKLHVQGLTVRIDEGNVAVAIKKYRLRSVEDAILQPPG